MTDTQLFRGVLLDEAGNPIQGRPIYPYSFDDAAKCQSVGGGAAVPPGHFASPVPIPRGWTRVEVEFGSGEKIVSEPYFHDTDDEVTMTLGGDGVLRVTKPGDVVVPPIEHHGDFPTITPLAQQFTANTFTAAVSYYGAIGAPLDRVKRDLTRFRAAGFGNSRIWIDWPETRAPGSSAMRSNGSFIEDKAAHLTEILDFMASLGMSADLTMRAAAYGSVKKSAEGYDISAHKTAVRNVLTRWGKHPAFRIFDMANEAEVRGEGNHGSPDVGHVSPGRLAELMTVARAVPHSCLVSVSISSGGDQHDVTKNYQQILRDVKVDLALAHWPRVSGWGAKEGPNAKALSKAVGIPTYNQEPSRNNYNGQSWPLSEFEQSFRSAKANGALGECFHGSYAFDLRTKDAFDQLDDTERQVVANVAGWIR